MKKQLSVRIGTALLNTTLRMLSSVTYYYSSGFGKTLDPKGEEWSSDVIWFQLKDQPWLLPLRIS